jgi:hypothetical protein
VLQRPHFFPDDKPSSVAHTVHRTKIIVAASVLGSPTGRKTAGGHPSASLAEVSLGLVKRRTTRGLPQVKPAW